MEKLLDDILDTQILSAFQLRELKSRIVCFPSIGDKVTTKIIKKKLGDY